MAKRKGVPATVLPVLEANVATVEGIQEAFLQRDDVSDRSLATATFLAPRLGRPLLLEGWAGVGKTELSAGRVAVHDARPLR